MDFLDVSTAESCKKESRRCGSDSPHVFNPWRTCVLTAVNGTYYTKMFLDNLLLAILRKRPQLLHQGVILLQENATPHPQRDVRAFSAGMRLENPRAYFILSRPCTLRLIFSPASRSHWGDADLNPRIQSTLLSRSVRVVCVVVVCVGLATELHFIICHTDGEVKRPCKWLCRVEEM